MVKRRFGGIIFLSFVFGLCNISFAGDKEYTYIPRGQAGGFSVIVDAFRMFQAKWEKMPILAQWGEIYTPSCNPWGYIAFQPSGPDIKGIKNYNAPRDIIVKVEEEKDSITYTWKYSNFDKGYRQINRVIITPKAMRADTALQFVKDAPQAVEFHPVLFPGGVMNFALGGGSSRETAILGKECLIKRKDGTEYKKTYPDQEAGFNWLEEDTREITFDLPKGRIRFSFASDDEKMALSFLGNAYFPYTIRNKRRAIVGILQVHPVIGKTINIHMDIRADEKLSEKPAPVEPLSFKDDIVVEIEKSKRSGVYLPDDEASCLVNFDNRWNDRERKLEILSEVVNYNNEVIYKNHQNITVEKNGRISSPLALPIKEPGIFYLNLTVSEKGAVIDRQTASFARVLPPFECPEEEAFFACDSGGTLSRHSVPEKLFTEEEKKINEEICDALYSLGIKRLRVCETDLWKDAEPEQGKFVFNPNADIVVDTILKHKMGVWLTGFESEFPAWALKQGKKHKVSAARNPNIPDDWALYEEYMSQVAKHFKGKVKYYEEANEPYLTMPWDPVYNERASAFYRGVKKGDPEAKITGCATYCIKPESYEKIKSFLEYKDAAKEIDIVTPHYYISSQIMGEVGGTLEESGMPPEDCLEDTLRLLGLARKYKLIVWNGENGHMTLPENAFPLGTFQDFQKAFVSLYVRDFLSKKSLRDIKADSQCWAIGYVGIGTFTKVPWTVQNDYGATYNAVGFWGTGGNILPFASAHATCAHLLETSEFKERIIRGSEDFYCFWFQRNKENIAAVWMKKGKAEWTTTIPKGVDYFNIVGCNKVFSGENKFTITGEPFYLYSKKLSEAEFRKVLTAGSLIPDKMITLQEIKLSKDKKAIQVFIRNNCPEEVKIDRLAIRYEGGQDDLKDIKLAPNKEVPIDLKLKKEIASNLLVEVTAEAGGKKYQKEQFVLFPSVKCAKSYGYLVATKAKGVVNIDGDLSEWKEAVPIVIKEEKQVWLGSGENPWNGPADCSGEGQVMWDETNFYFACKVTDDVYSNPYSDRNSTWKGDSIQFAIDILMDNAPNEGYNSDDQEIGIALSEKGPTIFRRTFGDKIKLSQEQGGNLPGAKLTVKPWEKGLIYEMSIPLKELPPLKIEEGTVVRFNFIINDNDGKGRMVMEVTPGISESKDPVLYKRMIFLE